MIQILKKMHPKTFDRLDMVKADMLARVEKVRILFPKVIIETEFDYGDTDFRQLVDSHNYDQFEQAVEMNLDHSDYVIDRDKKELAWSSNFGFYKLLFSNCSAAQAKYVMAEFEYDGLDGEEVSEMIEKLFPDINSYSLVRYAERMHRKLTCEGRDVPDFRTFGKKFADALTKQNITSTPDDWTPEEEMLMLIALDLQDSK